MPPTAEPRVRVNGEFGRRLIRVMDGEQDGRRRKCNGVRNLVAETILLTYQLPLDWPGGIPGIEWRNHFTFQVQNEQLNWSKRTLVLIVK